MYSLPSDIAGWLIRGSPSHSLPNDFADLLIYHDYRAAFSVEPHVSTFNYSRRWPVVTSIDLPHDIASVGIESIELMRSVASTNKQHAIGIRRSGDGTSTR